MEQLLALERIGERRRIVHQASVGEAQDRNHRRQTGADGDVARWNAIADRLAIPIEPSFGAGKIATAVFEALCEEALVQPTFVYDFPTEVSPLSKQRADDPDTVERFELYAGGFELANAFSELNDPAEQRRRFEAQLALDDVQGAVDPRGDAAARHHAPALAHLEAGLFVSQAGAVDAGGAVELIEAADRHIPIDEGLLLRSSPAT